MTHRNLIRSIQTKHHSEAISTLQSILTVDQAFFSTELRNISEVRIHIHSTPETEAQIKHLAKEVKSMVLERGRSEDGSTVKEVFIKDQRTGLLLA